MCSQNNTILKDETELGALYDALEQALLHGPVDVTWKEYKPQRSVLQNRLYWEYMTQLGEFTGHSKEDMHLFFRWKFIGPNKTEIMGQAFNALPSTQDLNVKEFAEYLRNIEVFASEQQFTFKCPAYYEDAWR